MNRFDYVRPATVSEAVAAAAVPGSVYLAAGTNLLDLMKGGVVQPKRLVDVSRLAPAGWRGAHRGACAQRRPRP
jgi:xanthine dehydrogenase YagS FAD-binding subunit